MTIPSPSVLHFRAGYNGIKAVYPDIDEFFADAAAVYGRRSAPSTTPAAATCSSTTRSGPISATRAARIRRPSAATTVDRLQERYARTINAAIEGRPGDLTITMHVCRGNFRSTWISSGGYEPVAETLLAGLGIDGYFLEYDTERAGGFEPLRFLPKGDKVVVLGLITSKSGTLENKDEVKRRIDEATKIRRRSISSACRRSAASPRPRRATSSPRRRSGRSSARSSRSPTRCGTEGSAVAVAVRPRRTPSRRRPAAGCRRRSAGGRRGRRRVGDQRRAALGRHQARIGSPAFAGSSAK